MTTPPHRLTHLKPGQTGIIERLSSHPETAYRLMQLGLCPGEPVKVLRLAPLGGPMAIEVMGYCLAIRRSDAEHVHLR